MANNCFINITLETGTEAETKALFIELTETFTRANCEKVGAFFGSDTRCIFDAKCEYVGIQLSIGGWVKWGYSDFEFTDMFRWLRSKADIRKFRMTYDGPECLLYGEYVLHGETIWKNFLEEKDFPSEADFEGYDSFVDAIEVAFKKAPATKVIEL